MINDPHLDKRLQVAAQNLRNLSTIDEDASLHVFLEGVTCQVRAHDEGTLAVDHRDLRDLRVDFAVDKGLCLFLPFEEARNLRPHLVAPAPHPCEEGHIVGLQCRDDERAIEVAVATLARRLGDELARMARGFVQ